MMVFNFNVSFLCAFTAAGTRLILKFELCNEVLLKNVADTDVAQHLMRLETCFGRHEQTGHCPDGGVAVHQQSWEWLLFFAH